MLRALLVGLLVSVAVTAFSRTGVLAGWETRAVDTFLFLRDRVAAPEITLIVIDDDAPLSRRRPPGAAIGGARALLPVAALVYARSGTT